MTPEPRVFHAGDPAPDDIAAVDDDAGDTWHRDGDYWDGLFPPWAISWTDLLTDYGPVREREPMQDWFPVRWSP